MTGETPAPPGFVLASETGYRDLECKEESRERDILFFLCFLSMVVVTVTVDAWGVSAVSLMH